VVGTRKYRVDECIIIKIIVVPYAGRSKKIRACVVYNYEVRPNALL